MSEFEALQFELTELLLGDDSDAPFTWSQNALQEGIGPLDFFNHVFTPAIAAVGDKFGRLDIFLPELIDAAERAKGISEQLVKPLLAEQGGGGEPRGKVVICSVQGDLHDIGKNMVALMLQVNGFDVVDLGVDVPVRTVLNRAREENADIVGLSSLMTTSMPYMKEVIELRDGFGLKEEFAVIVGGAPITPEYSAQIGADAFGRDAIEAVNECIALMKARHP
jgi:trimethylamine corrinoid protein